MEHEHIDGAVDYLEFQTTDMAATKSFYSTVFGWTFTDYGPDYASFQDARIDGGFERVAEMSKGRGALVVWYSKHLEQMQSKIQEHGGTILREIFEFPGGRRFHFADPAGNECAIWSER